MQVNFTLFSRFTRASKLLKIKMFAENAHQLPHNFIFFYTDVTAITTFKRLLQFLNKMKISIYLGSILFLRLVSL